MNDAELREAKAALRRRTRGLLAAMPADVRARDSAAACALLATQDFFVQARCVLAFLSLPREIDTAPLLAAAFAAGKRLAVPRVDRAQRLLHAVAIDQATDLRQGPLGIREPVAGAIVPPEQIDLVVAPGLAFDERGGRLGQGGGYYDRFLAAPGYRAFTCGLAFELQLVARVPAAANDRRVQAVVTEQRVVRCARGQ